MYFISFSSIRLYVYFFIVTHFRFIEFQNTMFLKKFHFNFISSLNIARKVHFVKYNVLFKYLHLLHCYSAIIRLNIIEDQNVFSVNTVLWKRIIQTTAENPIVKKVIKVWDLLCKFVPDGSSQRCKSWKETKPKQIPRNEYRVQRSSTH